MQVDVLEYYPDDTVLVRSAHASHLVPAVMRVRVYVQRDWKHAKVSLSRRNVMLRDRFCCQCAAAVVEQLTGTRTSFACAVAMCCAPGSSCTSHHT